MVGNVDVMLMLGNDFVERYQGCYIVGVSFDV